ncbi:MAG: HD-GYP domain-containing protein [bacterium]
MLKQPLEEIEPGDIIAADVRVHSDDPNVQYRIRLDKGTALTRKHINRLSREGIGYLFIRDRDLGDLDPFIYDEEIESAEESLALELKDIGRDIETGAGLNFSIRKLRDALDDLLNAIQDTDAMLAFSTLKSHSDYTAKHSIDVAKFCLYLVLSNQSELRKKLKEQSGASHEYTNKYMLEDIGLGALLHDLGKWIIPNEVLKKNGKLDDREWEAVKSHPESGADMLKNDKSELRAPVTIPALQHHEQYNGGGYPRGLAGDSIHLYGRVTAICDVYSALTSDRPYRVRKTPNRARQEMWSMQKGEEHFDPEILELFMKTFPPFPIGQQVILSNGARGVVSEVPDTPSEPIVRVLYEGNKRLDESYEIQANRDSNPEIIN